MSDNEHCECDNPGFCLRYNKQMTNRTHKICRGEVLTPEKCEEYRKHWLEIRPTGLGDVVHRVARATGLEKVANGIAKLMGKKGCGCRERQKRLNQVTVSRKRDVSEARKNCNKK